MLIEVDVKGLEVVCAAYLSRDPVLMDEIIHDKDFHEDNRVRFNLPTRLIAKIFTFRLIYGGSAYSYAHDPDFAEVHYSEKQWQGVIDEYYRKYKGLYEWHIKLLQEVTTTGRITLPTGRCFEYNQIRRGMSLEWPRTQILNYPVQGFGADLLCFARVTAFRLMKGLKAKLVSTVHDSIVVDAPSNEVSQVIDILRESVSSIPKMFEELFGIPFDLPMRSEIKMGLTLGDLTKV